MGTAMMGAPSTRQQRVDEQKRDVTDAAWKPMYVVGAVAALLEVGVIAGGVIVYIINPPPTTIADWFALFHRNALLGLLDLDLLMMVGTALMGLIYFALYGALRRAGGPLTALATVIGLVSVTTFFASNTAFNMLVLSNQYDAATTDAERAQIMAAGRAMLATWQGSAYDVSYVLGGVAILLFAVVMLRSNVFGKATAYVGLVLGVLMLVPATVAGTVGIVISLASLLPTVIWCILVARRFFALSSA
ncbi:MAG: hypothetical protein OJF49_000949 [Ktedonobacterales bacterium]|jgi:hypothetical protein|nr:MAG: hypothetical protein OJF49_000949 [Ktedonobacterales bacterium]